MAPPRTLTRAQFRKTAAAKSGGTYDHYLHYLAVHRARLGVAPTDPLAPTDPRLLQQQASQAVHAQIDPLVTQIQGEFGRRTSAGTSAITAGTRQLMEAAKQYAPAEQAAYGQATDQMNTLNTALANRLTGQGTALQGDLQAKLAQINAPGATQDAVAVGTGAIGAGAANAGFAQGAANISDLIARGAAARDYGAKLPGIAALTGTRHLRDLAAQTEHERATALGDIRAKIPGLVSDQLTNARNLEYQKAVAKLGFAGDQATIAAENARAAASIGAQNQRTAAQIDAANQRAAARTTATSTATKTRQAATDRKAIAAANRTALSIIQKAAKATVQKQVTAGGGPFGGTSKTVKATVTPVVGSEAYYRAIHQAETAIEPLLPADWTPQQITQFVQRLANQYFKQPPKRSATPPATSTSKDPAVNPNAAGPPAP